MEGFVPAVVILAAHAAIAFILGIVRDVVNGLLRGETPLVLEKLSTTRLQVSPETPQVEIQGRPAGLLGNLLALLDLSPQVRFIVHSQEVRKTTWRWHGHSLKWIPLSPNVSLRARSQRNGLWLMAAVLSFTGGAASGLVMGETFAARLMNAVAWLVVGGFYLFAYARSQTFQIAVEGTLRAAVSFKPRALDGRWISFDEVLEAAEAIFERIQMTRGSSSSAPVPPHEFTSDPEETPGPAPALAASDGGNGAEYAPPARTAGTGTVEYGEENGFRSSAGMWDGEPEPGTSDSIQLQRSVSRSDRGLSLGIAEDQQDLDYDEADFEEQDTDHTGGAYRGTVSWEDQVDKTQDETRAEAELADLKRSRPKRGEAKLRLRELIRRFPQTEAAHKARRMLERLESGQ